MRPLPVLALVVGLWWAGLHAFGAACAVAVCGLLLVRPRRRPLAAAMVAGCLAVFVAEWPGAQEALVARARAGTWNHAERAATYALHAAMAAGGLVAGYPEVALEAARLHVPGPDLSLASDFPLRSVRFREAVHEGLCRSDAFDVRVAWPGHDGADARMSLALNPADVRCEATDTTVTCTSRVPVDYGFLERPTPLVPGVFAVYDALFAALQRDGWLFPYHATWTTTWPRPTGRC